MIASSTTILREQNIPVTFSVPLPAMDSHMRKLIRQEIAKSYPMLSIKETIEDNIVTTHPL